MHYLTIINTALKAQPHLLSRAAPAVQKLTGQAVKATSAGVMDAIRRWAANNPKKFLIATNLLATIGFDFTADQITDVLGDLTDHPDLVALVHEVEQTLLAERDQHSGDGQAETIHGMRKEEYVASVEKLTSINQKISLAIRACGSLGALRAIREAVFLEDEDFDLYTMTRA